MIGFFPFSQVLLGYSISIWYIYQGAVDLYLYAYSFDWLEVTQTTAFRLLLLISLLTLWRFYLRDYTAGFSVEDSSAKSYI